MDFLINHWIEILWAFVFAVLIEIIFKPFRHWREQIKKLQALYSFIGKSSQLKPGDLLGHRPYNPYYYPRKEDELIIKCLNDKKNLLIIGSPLNGKSRSLFQALKLLSKPQKIAITICHDINIETFKLPKNIEIIVIDDLQRFVEQQNYDYVFKTTLKNNVVIAAITRSGIEYRKVENKMLDDDISLDTVFSGNIIEHPRISKEIGKDIANEALIPWNSVQFDGTVGSVFMRLEEIMRRINNCNDIEKTILHSIKILYICGIYEYKSYPIKWIKVSAKGFGLEGKDFEWNGWLDKLKQKELIIHEGKNIQVEEVYLDSVVKLPPGIEFLEVCENTISLFSDIPEALFKLATRIFNIGTVSLELPKLISISIQALREVLKGFSLNFYPLEYANSQNLLGMAFCTLSDVENRAENCIKSIDAFKEALKVRTMESYPVQYASIHNNIGITFNKLGLEVNKSDYCKKAISAFNEALKVRTINVFPLEYSMTQNNLSNTFCNLAKVENKLENCEKAIKCCTEALKILTLDRFPLPYAFTYNNLGNAYSRLSEIVNKSVNCKNAIECFKKALSVPSINHLLVQYSIIQNNLGKAYNKLSDIEDKADNCRLAIEAFEEALKFTNSEHFPDYYRIIQKRLGISYSTLADFKDKSTNCNKAVQAFKESLKVSPINRFPTHYSAIQIYLGNVYIILSEISETSKNCKMAINAYEEALIVNTFENDPIGYAVTENNIGNAYLKLSAVETNLVNFKKAIKAYEETLEVYSLSKFPLNFAISQENLGFLYGRLIGLENKCQNCKKSIKAYKEALKVFTQNEFPQKFTLLTSNLKLIANLCHQISHQ